MAFSCLSLFRWNTKWVPDLTHMLEKRMYNKECSNKSWRHIWSCRSSCHHQKEGDWKCLHYIKCFDDWPQMDYNAQICYIDNMGLNGPRLMEQHKRPQVSSWSKKVKVKVKLHEDSRRHKLYLEYLLMSFFYVESVSDKLINSPC